MIYVKKKEEDIYICNELALVSCRLNLFLTIVISTQIFHVQYQCSGVWCGQVWCSSWSAENCCHPRVPVVSMVMHSKSVRTALRSDVIYFCLLLIHIPPGVIVCVYVHVQDGMCVYISTCLYKLAVKLKSRCCYCSFLISASVYSLTIAIRL